MSLRYMMMETDNKPYTAMITSDIVLPKQQQTMTTEEQVPRQPTSKEQPRLVVGYRHERSRQEYAEVELNRTKIVMIDEHGNLKRVSLIPEH